MDSGDLMKVAAELDAYLREYDECAITPTRKLIAAYVKGQLGPLPRKSIMPIARAAGIAPRTLQELLSLHRWDEELLRSLFQRRARRLLGGEDVLAVLHRTVVPKRGRKTPGVELQERGVAGRRVNCCVIVHLSLAGEGNRLVLDGEVYLPRSWTDDPSRLHEAGIPEGRAYRPEGEIGLGLLDRALKAGFRPGWVLFDPSGAADPGFLRGLGERNLRYVTEVPPEFRGWVDAPRPRERLPRAPTLREQVRDRPLQGVFQFPGADSRRETGVFPIGVFSFAPEPEFGGDGPHVLLALRHPWNGEFRFFVGNVPPSMGAPSLMEIVLSRGGVESQAGRDLEAIGFGHFEVRNFRSLQRHLRLSEASLLFLAEQRASRPRPSAGASKVRRAESV